MNSIQDVINNNYEQLEGCINLNNMKDLMRENDYFYKKIKEHKLVNYLFNTIYHIHVYKN